MKYLKELIFRYFSENGKKKSKTIKNNFLDYFKIKNIKILELIFGGEMKIWAINILAEVQIEAY
jgi:hypothetical protein